MKEDPIVQEVRETRQRLFEEAGGTIDSFIEFVKLEAAKIDHP